MEERRDQGRKERTTKEGEGKRRGLSMKGSSIRGQEDLGSNGGLTKKESGSMKGRGASCTLTSPFTRLHFPRATKDYRGLLVTSIHLPLSSLRQISVDFQWLPHISCHLSIQSPRQAVGSHALLQRHFIKESTRHSNKTVILNSDGEIHFSWMVHPSPLFRTRFTESRSPMPSPLRLSTIGEPRVN